METTIRFVNEKYVVDMLSDSFMYSTKVKRTFVK